jgi:DNA replication protein DnaC
MSETRPLLRDLITIPEKVQTSDFVLKLAEGVSEERASATIRDYVVTPQLAKAFDAALGIIHSAIEGRRSVACYLHGSFGSGKSHFMAVLDLLLAGYQQARAKTELAAVVSAHDAWLSGKRFLMVPYHMIAQRLGQRDPRRLRRVCSADAPKGAGTGVLPG